MFDDDVAYIFNLILLKKIDGWILRFLSFFGARNINTYNSRWCVSYSNKLAYFLLVINLLALHQLGSVHKWQFSNAAYEIIYFTLSSQSWHVISCDARILHSSGVFTYCILEYTDICRLHVLDRIRNFNKFDTRVGVLSQFQKL